MKTLKEKLQSYNLPYQSLVDVIEAVNALDKYEKLPQAVKDSLQVIADINNLFFNFAEYRKKLVLYGIGTPYLRGTYLYPDGKIEESQKKIKGKKYILSSGANNKLQEVKE